MIFESPGHVEHKKESFAIQWPVHKIYFGYETRNDPARRHFD